MVGRQRDERERERDRERDRDDKEGKDSMLSFTINSKKLTCFQNNMVVCSNSVFKILKV